jgi:hypothetical protein
MPKDTGEHNTIADYVREAGGRTYFEVPVSGPKVTPGSSARRIDAVRIEGLEDGLRDFERDPFIADLREARLRDLEVELIEAKDALNRPIIGQAIAGCDLFIETYEDAGANLTSSIVVDKNRNDAALYRVCQRRGIRVHLREWIPRAVRDKNHD